MTHVRATAIGSTALLMLATLALLTKVAGEIPPLELTALTFAVSTLVGCGMWWRLAGDVVYH